MASSTQKRTIILTADTHGAEVALKALQKDAKKLSQEMTNLERTGQRGSQRWKELNKLLQENARAQKQFQQEVTRVDKTMKNLANASTRQLKEALSVLRKEIMRTSESSGKLPLLNKQFAAIQAQIDKNTAGMRGFRKETTALGTAIKNVTAYFGTFTIAMQGISKMKQAFTDNLKLSDQMTDIQKVSGLAAREVRELTKNISQIDSRTGVEQLNKLAYAGARLGIGEYGVAGLEGFTKAANQLSMALHEDLGDEAIGQLSKMTEVMGDMKNMGVERALLSTGSAIFKLASTSTANGEHIVQFAQRLTGIAKASHMTTDQILALGSAADSMMLMPEVASTAFNKFITSLQTNYAAIEKDLQMEQGTLKAIIEDPTQGIMGGITTVLKAMKEKGGMNALNFMFKDMGSDGARLKAVLVSMSQNIDILEKHLDTANDAFREGTAVTKEYMMQNETAAAYMERAGNVWQKAFMNPDDVDVVKEFAKSWYNLSKAITGNAAAMGMMRTSLTLILTIIQSILYLMPALIPALMFKGVVTACASVAASFGVMGGSAVVAAFEVGGLTAAWNAMTLAMKTNVIGAVITILGALGMAIYSIVGKAEKAKASLESFKKTQKELTQTISVNEGKLKSFRKAIDGAAQGTRERAAAIKNFNKEYGGYLKNMLTERSTALDVAKAYEEVCKQLRQKAILEMKTKDWEKRIGARLGWESNRLFEFDDAARAAGSGFQGSNLKGYAEDNAGASWERVAADLAQRLDVKDKSVIKHLLNTRGQELVGGKDYMVTGANYRATGPGTGYVENEIHKYTKNELALGYALAYVAQHRSTVNQQRAFDRDWSIYDDELPQVEGVDESRAVDLGGSGGGGGDTPKTKAEKDAEARKALRDELSQEQDRAKAIIDNVKNFYERQLNAIQKTATEAGLSEAQQAMLLQPMRDRMDLALSQVRLAIAGQENEWETFKETMEKDIRELTDETGVNLSEVLFNEISINDIDALHAKMASLADQLGLPSNAVIAQIFKNASLNQGNILSAANKQQQARQAAARQDDYTGAVQFDYAEKFEQFGFLQLTEKEKADILANNEVAIDAIFKERVALATRAYERARTNITDVLTLDTSTEEGKKALLNLVFMGEDPSVLSRMMQMSESEWQLYYSTLIKYAMDYTDAQKRTADRYKKEYDFLWNMSPQKTTLDNDERRQKYVGEGTTVLMRAARGVAGNPYNDDSGNGIPRSGEMGGTAYMEQWSYDPELEAYKLKLQAAQEYYDFILAHQHTAEQAHDAELARIDAMNDYTKALIKQMKERVEAILELTAPIDTFGEKAGEAFALMTEDAEAGRDALKKATADMINDFLKQTVTMAQEYIKRRLLQKINDRLVSVQMKKQQMQEMASETAHQTTMTSIKESAGEVNVALEESVGAQISAAKAANATTDTTIAAETAATEVTTEAGATTAKVGLGIASGAAKTIGSLGWWGIPLIAVISAVLSGLLGFAMSKVSSFLGGGSKATTDGPNAKLVSGMLTYDAGNVQTVLGTDGRLYRARPVDQLPTGIVSSPIATQVNGQPALVGERGPELVVGRETTAAIQMQEPELLQKILAYDRARSGARQALDAGNAQQVLTPATNTASLPDIAAFTAAVRAFQQTVAALQQNGIKAHINKFGRGGLVEEVKSGLDWDARHQ